MNTRFAIFIVAGIAVVAGLLFLLLTGTSGAHLRLDGKILKVRVLALSGGAASLVMVDFRANNPSDVPFVVSAVKLRLIPAKGDPLEGTTISKTDLNNVFQYEKLLGPKFNDALSLQDRVAPHQRVDRMAGARFEIPEAQVNTRKELHLQLEDVDGTVSDFTEAGDSGKP